MSHVPHTWVEAGLAARITAHVHAWEQAKQAGQPLAPETYPFITLSREYGCEAVPVALKLSEILNERCRPFFAWVAYDQQLLDKVAQELHLHRGVVEAVDGRRRSAMNEFFQAILSQPVDDTVIFRKLAEVIRALAIHGNAVLVGRGSHLITQDLKTGLHVRLVAPRDWRISQLASKRNVSHGDAERLVNEGDEQREKFLQTFFVQDPRQPFHHDLVLDASRFNLDQVTEIVFTALSVRYGETLVGN